MKAISLQQPFANWVAGGKKTIETRTWPTNHRGLLLIVSSKSPPITPAGFAVAIVKVVDCRPMTQNDETAAYCKLYPRAWAWILEDIQAIKPFPVKGSLGIYNVDVLQNKIEVIRSSERSPLNHTIATESDKPDSHYQPVKQD